MRVIIRFSIDRDDGLRPELVGHLRAEGYTNTGTATWEHPTTNAIDILSALNGFWKRVSSHKGVATLDHFWMYADERPAAPTSASPVSAARP